MTPRAANASQMSLVPQSLQVDSGDADVEVNLAPAEILIVEDDAATLERLQLLAEDAGYSVYTAGNGLEALQLLRERFCALVLADMIMPVMSGTSLCAAIRETPFPSYVYTIALSAHDDPDDIVSAFDAGADDFLSKQATRSELLARLRAGRRVVGLEQSLRNALDVNRTLCHVDALTRCFNKRYLIPALDRELVRSKQHQHWVSVLTCEIDNFTNVSDIHGDAVCNEVLREVAERINALIRESGAAWLAFCGSDEFVVIMPETSIEQACAQAEAIKQDFCSEPVSCSAGALPLTVSIGASGAGPSELRQAVSAGKLLAAAENCTRESKAAGGNTVRVRVYQHHKASVRYLPTHRKDN